MIIDFTPEGAAQAMHIDQFDLGFLGNKHVERATEIRFNETSQKWDIALPRRGNMVGSNEDAIIGFSVPFPEAEGFETYEGARQIEVLWLNRCRRWGIDPDTDAGRRLLIEAAKQRNHVCRSTY